MCRATAPMSETIFLKIEHPPMGLDSEDMRLRVELNFRIKFHIKVSRNALIGELRKLINDVLRDSYRMRIPSYAICTQDGFEILEMFRLGDILENGQLILIDPFNNANNLLFPCDEEQAYKPAITHKERGAGLSNRAIKNEASRKGQTEHRDIERKRPGKSIVINSTKSANQPLEPLKEKAASTQPIEATSTKDPVVDKDSENAKNKDEKIDNERDNLKPEGNAELEAVRMPVLTNAQVNPIAAADKKPSESAASAFQPPKPDNFKGFVVRKADLTKNESTKFEEQGYFKPLKKRKTEEDVFEIL